MLKFIYSEKVTKFCEAFTLLLTGTTQDKSKVKISQNFVAFSEYMNFNINGFPFPFQVFFDDGYASYIKHEDIRVVCAQTENAVYEDIHPNSRDFVRKYLLQYPERPMVKLGTGKQTLISIGRRLFQSNFQGYLDFEPGSKRNFCHRENLEKLQRDYMRLRRYVVYY